VPFSHTKPTHLTLHNTRKRGCCMLSLCVSLYLCECVCGPVLLLCVSCVCSDVGIGVCVCVCACAFYFLLPSNTTTTAVGHEDVPSAPPFIVDPSVCWDDVAWLRSCTRMKLVVKGIQCGEVSGCWPARSYRVCLSITSVSIPNVHVDTCVKVSLCGGVESVLLLENRTCMHYAELQNVWVCACGLYLISCTRQYDSRQCVIAMPCAHACT